MTSWARPCTFWEEGECKKGISSPFKHQGFPISESRCITCKSTTNKSGECTSPGGGADPDREKHWKEYRDRKLKAISDGLVPQPTLKGLGKTNIPKGSFKGLKGGSSSKSSPKGGKGVQGGTFKGHPKAKATAKACVEMAAAVQSDDKRFPRNGVVLTHGRTFGCGT